MRIITSKAIRQWAAENNRAASSLNRWLEFATLAKWKSLADVRQVYRDADEVRVRSGRTVVIFNINGGHHRLITAIHYNRGIVYTLRFLTHAEYDTDRWKKDL